MTEFPFLGYDYNPYLNKLRRLFPSTTPLLVKWLALRDENGYFDSNKIHTIKIVTKKTDDEIAPGQGDSSVEGTFGFTDGTPGDILGVYKEEYRYIQDLFSCAQPIGDYLAASFPYDAVQTLIDSGNGEYAKTDSIQFALIDEYIHTFTPEPLYNFGNGAFVSYFTTKVLIK